MAVGLVGPAAVVYSNLIEWLLACLLTYLRALLCKIICWWLLWNYWTLFNVFDFMNESNCWFSFRFNGWNLNRWNYAMLFILFNYNEHASLGFWFLGIPHSLNIILICDAKEMRVMEPCVSIKKAYVNYSHYIFNK